MGYAVTGSGQLAWMLSLSAKKLGFDLRYVNLPSEINKEDIVTFESEFLDLKAWREALSDKIIYPSLDIMQKLSDKWEQKLLFKKYQLPTAKADLHASSEFPSRRPIIAKWARQGYDGYGNLVLKDGTDSKSKWMAFLEKAFVNKSRIYLEEIIKFESECALVVARDKDGKFLKYPLFLTDQSNSVCHWVWGPTGDFNPAMQAKVDELWPQLQNFLTDLNYVGVIAFEFFWGGGELLLNEVAPRVHNSGHITLDAFNYSQFDLHLMAPLGFKSIELKALSSNYVMKNILGSENFEVEGAAYREEVSDEQAFYWYGKNEVRPGRKMGHLNMLYSNRPRDEIRTELNKKEELLWQKLKIK